MQVLGLDKEMRAQLDAEEQARKTKERSMCPFISFHMYIWAREHGLPCQSAWIRLTVSLLPPA